MIGDVMEGRSRQLELQRGNSVGAAVFLFLKFSNLKKNLKISSKILHINCVFGTSISWRSARPEMLEMTTNITSMKVILCGGIIALCCPPWCACVYLRNLDSGQISVGNSLFVPQYTAVPLFYNWLMLAFLFLLFTGNQLYEMRRDMCFDVRPLLHTHKFIHLLKSPRNYTQK